MAIRTRNLHHKVYHLKSSATLTAAGNKDCVAIEFPGYITNLVGKLGTAGTGSTNTIADVHKNGTTIFAAATKATFAATTGTATYSALDDEPTPVVAGDLLTLDVDQISSGPANLDVAITVSRGPHGATGNLSDHDDVL